MGSGVKKILFGIIDELRLYHSLSLLLGFSEISKSGYYKWKNTPSSVCNNEDLKQHILAINSLRPFYGYRRVTIALKREGFIVNHKRVYRLMKELCLKSTIRKKRKYFGKKGGYVFENILNRDFTSTQARKKLVTDITYLPSTNGFIYLSAIQDLYNNEILAYTVSCKNNLELVFDTLSKLPVIEHAILHSDQGFQYTHKDYQQKLLKLNLLGSHSRRGNCLDNACIESFFSHLKTEMLTGNTLMEESELSSCIARYIEFYNRERFQKRLGQLSPIEYREKLAA